MPGAATAPITEDMGWHIGEDFVFDIVVDDGTVGTPPDDIDTWSDVRWFVRETPEDEDLQLELTMGAGVEFVAPATFRISVAANQTERWYPGTYWHTLSRMDGPIEDVSEGPAVIRHSARRNP